MPLERGQIRGRRKSLFGSATDLLYTAAGSAIPLAVTAQQYLNDPTRRGSSRYRGAPPSPPPSPRQMPRSAKGFRRRSMSPRTRRSRSRSRVRGSAGGIMSRQRDQSTRFRLGRRRPSRRYRRFVRRVQTVVNNDAPIQTWTKKLSANGTSAVDKMAYYGVGLYTSQQSDMPDLSNIFTDAGLPIATATNLTSRLNIKSAVLDVEIKNTGSVEMIFDIYEVLNMKDVSTTDPIATQYDSFFGKLTTLTAKDSADVCNSLFENPVFCQHYKILNKRSVLVLPSEIITMQMRIAKDRVIQAQEVADNPGSIPKKGRFFFFMWHGAPDPTAGGPTTPGIASTNMTISWQKVYKYALAPNPRQVAQMHNA